MSHANIGDAPAQKFAEYVQTEPLPSPIFPAEDTAHEGSRLRPPLPYRIHSHRLRVQAHAKSQRVRLLSGPLVDVYVGSGEGKRHWALHRNLLCYHSDYLASELETVESTKTKPGNKLELTDDDPKGFELLVKWLYQGKLEDVSDISDANSKYDYAVACHKLYILCERFDMPQLKNMAIDQYRKGLGEARLVPDADEINDIYRQSPEGSPFRVLMTKIAARQIMDPDSEKDAENYRACFENNPDFAIDLVNAIKIGTGGMLFDDPTTGDECAYHDHDGGPNCHIKGKGKQGVRKPLFRSARSPPSPPSTPPETPPFATPYTSSHAAARQSPKFSPKINGLNTADDVNYAQDAGGDTSPTRAKVQPESDEHGVGQSPGRGTPKRHPPKLRRRGSTSARQPAAS